jgi:pantoate--beta-alanine ligase
MTEPELLEGVPAVTAWRRRLPLDRTLGFVPTMGALHEGHLSLVRAAKAENDLVLASIYVNPIQFGPEEDIEAYPRNLNEDLRRVAEAGGDAVATFQDREMYMPGYSTYVDVEGLTEGLCGAGRPGHFRGVTTVVTKLFHLVRPDRAYFGRKDAQQAGVIRRMTEDLAFGIEIRVMPIVREQDGLAMSSRNAYLSGDERKRAACLYRALCRAREAAASGERDAEALRSLMEGVIREESGGSARIDYVEIVNPETFRPVEKLEVRALAALAVQVGPARLIDNMFLE